MLTRARIAVLVSGGGTNLQALLDAQRDGKMPHGEIVLVVSSRAGAYALTRAENAGVAARMLSPACGQKPFENELSVLLREQKIDLILLAGFTVILSAEFTKQWPRRILNVHPSLIPAFCGKGMYGLRVHEAALARGVKVTGATVHFVNEIPDGGEILLQKAMDKLMRDRTCFVIAHRLSTIVDADLILVINDGQIVETGTHEALLEKQGFYYRLYTSQYAV